ncbi:hydrogenase formation protein HypD [Candidatus Woesearchaeota archaeon]|nr:hydrogenase formation protein HypD [Candidatus Woesearchaeota archaeon]
MRNKKFIDTHIRKIKTLSEKINKNITLMEICGGHTTVIMKYGIREILPDNVSLISGPGCPVCVSSQKDIDCVIELAKNNIPVATYGDMLRVPGTRDNLEKIKAESGNVFEVYSTTEVISLKNKYPDIVFFGVGFETTAPMTAYLLKKKICVYSVHKIIPPAMKILISGNVKIDGFINPGHVSTIIGVKEYKEIEFPQVISGFTPEQIIRGVSMLLELISKNENKVVNGYREVVRNKGNEKAKRLLNEMFSVEDSEWRGLGNIADSGLEVADNGLNAKIKYDKIISSVPEPKKTACRCGDVLKGLIEPGDCPLYRKVCTPENPKGACMVSKEGSCAIYYEYGK